MLLGILLDTFVYPIILIEPQSSVLEFTHKALRLTPIATPDTTINDSIAGTNMIAFLI